MGGFERVYEIAASSATRAWIPKHNPEFTTIELYEAYADFHDMMDIAEGILSHRRQGHPGLLPGELAGRGHRPDPRLAPPDHDRRVKQYVGVDFDAISDDEEACRAVEAKGHRHGGL